VGSAWSFPGSPASLVKSHQAATGSVTLLAATIGALLWPPLLRLSAGTLWLLAILPILTLLSLLALRPILLLAVLLLAIALTALTAIRAAFLSTFAHLGLRSILLPALRLMALTVLLVLEGLPRLRATRLLRLFVLHTFLLRGSCAPTFANSP